MAKFFKRYRRRYTKRNAERHVRAGSSTVPASSQVVAYTYVATDACVVKSLKLDTGVTVGSPSGVPYVMVHVREGYDVNSITYPAVTTDLYNPTADVLISGILTDNAVEDHKYNMIGRKLKKGDRIALLYYSTAGGEIAVQFELNFSVLT